MPIAFGRGIEATGNTHCCQRQQRCVLSAVWRAVQSEYGDLYKVTVSADGADKGRVTELKIKYFDTLPTCTSVCVLRTGFLFAASEFGNHALYQFQVPCAQVCCIHKLGRELHCTPFALHWLYHGQWVLRCCCTHRTILQTPLNAVWSVHGGFRWTIMLVCS